MFFNITKQYRTNEEIQKKAKELVISMDLENNSDLIRVLILKEWNERNKK